MPHGDEDRQALDQIALALGRRMQAERDDLEEAVVVKVPRLLSVAHVAKLLDCSPATVRRRVRDGSLAAVTEGDRMMVRGDDLRAYIDQLARVGPAAGHRRTRAPRMRHDFSFLRE